MSPMGGPPSVFISYSHDSPEHVAAVLELSNRLRGDGVDCQVDQYEMSPPEGWPNWMLSQIERADFVLVVATETYNNRVSGRGGAGRGRGIMWEGAIITQSLYESEGRNEKFIPIVLKATDIVHIPSFVASVTRYDLSAARGYEDLYRHLTSQPRVAKPALGALRDLPPSTAPDDSSDIVDDGESGEDFDQIVLFFTALGSSQVTPYESITFEDELVIVVRPPTPQASGFMAGLRDSSTQPVGVAFDFTAVLATVRSIQQQFEGGGESWRIVLTPNETDYGVGFMELSTTGFSADRLAEMRARRILLNESLSEYVKGSETDPDNIMLEVLVRGQSTPITIEKSPLPELYSNTGENPAFFIAVARLLAVLWLRLGGVTEIVNRLELDLQGDVLRVDFQGVRPRKYANAEPVAISVTGECNLNVQEQRRIT